MALEKRSETKGKWSTTEFVSLLPILSTLSPKVISRLWRLISIERIPSRTLLIEEGKVQDRVFILIEGLLQLFTHRGTDEATLGILKPPTFVFAEAVLRDVSPLASVRTLQTCCVGYIAVDQARKLFEQEREFARILINDLMANWRSMLQETKNARTRTGIQRLIAWVLAMQGGAETPSEIMLPYDKGILASRLGVAPATLSRDFARLARLGVTVRRRKLEIRDASQLRKMTTIDESNTPPVP